MAGSSVPAAYKAACDISCQNGAIEILINFWIENGTTPVDQRGDTILHILAIYGNSRALGSLVDDGFLSNEDLLTKNVYGDTPLHEAARFGKVGIVKILLQRQRNLTLACNNRGENPLFVAAASGKKDVFMLLLRDDALANSLDGCTVLHAAVNGEHYRLTLIILEYYPYLASQQDNKGETALNLLSTQVSAFKSGSYYLFRDLGARNFVISQLVAAVLYICIPALYRETGCCGSAEDPHDAEIGICKNERSALWDLLFAIPWCRETDEAKQRHVLAGILAKRLILKEDWSRYIQHPITSEPEQAKMADHPLIQAAKHGIDKLVEEMKKMIIEMKIDSEPEEPKCKIEHPLIQAAKLGINELVEEILKVHPEALEATDENGRNLLHIAVEQKNTHLYDYLMMKTGDQKYRMMNDVDNNGNNILHFATSVGTTPYTPAGLFNQMIWDVLWYKRIQFNTYQHSWNAKNKEGATPRELFDEKHTDIRKEAEKATKEMSNCLLIVAVLIATISAASVYTVPGAFTQDTGIPLLLKTEWQKDFEMLLTYLGGTLLCSIISMGSLIAIILSKFDTDDFYVSLPFRYFVAIGGLFYSACFLTLAGTQTFILERTPRENMSTLMTLLFCCTLAGVVYIDTAYTSYDYMYCVFRYSFSYRRQLPEENA